MFLKKEEANKLAYEYFLTKDKSIREDLLEKLRIQVESIVRFYINKKKIGDFYELLCDGYVGAWEAIENYNPKKVNSRESFLVYSGKLIYGRIIDGIRKRECFFTRSIYNKIQELNEYENSFFVKNGFNPTIDEKKQFLAEKGYSGTVKYYDGIFSLLNMIRLNNEIKFNNKGNEIKDSIESDCKTPLEELLDKELREIIISDLRTIPKKYGKVIESYFLNGLTMKETGRILGISEGRASQICIEFLNSNYFSKTSRLMAI